MTTEDIIADVLREYRETEIRRCGRVPRVLKEQEDGTYLLDTGDSTCILSKQTANKIMERISNEHATNNT